MHEYGIHCYNPTDNSLVLINTVSVKNQSLSKIQIDGAEQTKTLYTKLGYPTVRGFRWIFQNQQTIDFPVTVQDIDIAPAIWGKNISALKGNTTRKKLIHVSGEIVIIPKELIEIQKYVFMIAEIFFINGIPFFISLSCNITFTTVIHIEDIKSITIFKVFK